jgi:hypothetical protein
MVETHDHAATTQASSDQATHPAPQQSAPSQSVSHTTRSGRPSVSRCDSTREHISPRGGDVATTHKCLTALLRSPLSCISNPFLPDVQIHALQMALFSAPLDTAHQLPMSANGPFQPTIHRSVYSGQSRVSLFWQITAQHQTKQNRLKGSHFPSRDHSSITADTRHIKKGRSQPDQDTRLIKK